MARAGAADEVRYRVVRVGEVRHAGRHGLVHNQLGRTRQAIGHLRHALAAKQV